MKMNRPVNQDRLRNIYNIYLHDACEKLNIDPKNIKPFVYSNDIAANYTVSCQYGKRYKRFNIDEYDIQTFSVEVIYATLQQNLEDWLQEIKTNKLILALAEVEE